MGTFIIARMGGEPKSVAKLSPPKKPPSNKSVKLVKTECGPGPPSNPSNSQNRPSQPSSLWDPYYPRKRPC